MSELRFIDKLREATKEGVPDSQLVDECMELVNKFAPNIANDIPSDTQEKMLDAAHRQEKIFKDQGFKVTPKCNRSILAHETTGITVEW